MTPRIRVWMDWLYQWLRQHLTHSLRTQVALVIASLSFLPNLVLILAFYWFYPQPIQISVWQIVALLIWLMILGVLSSVIAYFIASVLLRPLTALARELSHLATISRQPLLNPWTLTQQPKDPVEALVLRGAFAQLLQQVQLEQGRRAAFTATLMHDLKTPLVAFRHLLTALNAPDPLPLDQQQEILHQLLQENSRILELVQKMVAVHRLEQREVKLTRHPCDLGSLAQELVKRLEPVALQRGIQLQASGEGWANIDRSELERALYNLVDNALRYARQQVSITVQASELSVQDDGPGLPAPLEELAQPYTAQPIEIAGQRYTAGSGGLGLFIARRILEAHGGSLQLECTGSEGTTLRLLTSPPF